VLVVEIILKRPNGDVLARVEGNAHEPLRWSEPIVDDDERLQLLRVFYDPDSRPLPEKSDR
jgi:hypothetical protein